jgi:hypothetical protein
VLRRLAVLLPFRRGGRDQALVREIAEFAVGLLRGELRDVLLDSRNRAHVGVLDVDVEGAGDRVPARRDVVEARRHAVHPASLEPVAVLVEKAEAKDAECVRVRHQLLHDQVVVLSGLHVGAILADRVADRLVPVLVRLLERLDVGEGLAASLHGELVEGVPGARGGRGPEHLDLHVRQRGVHVLPGPVRVGDPVPAGGGNLLGEGQEDLSQGELEGLGLLRVGDHDPVVADLDLGDVGDPVLRAAVDLGFLDSARGVGEVGMVDADTGAEELQPAAGAGALDDGCLEAGAPPELLRHHGGEGVDGGGADDPDLVPGRRRPRKGARDREEKGRNENASLAHDGVSDLGVRGSGASRVQPGPPRETVGSWCDRSRTFV